MKRRIRRRFGLAIAEALETRRLLASVVSSVFSYNTAPHTLAMTYNTAGPTPAAEAPGEGHLGDLA